LRAFEQKGDSAAVVVVPAVGSDSVVVGLKEEAYSSVAIGSMTDFVSADGVG
jgi:hypothetical protein